MTTSTRQHIIAPDKKAMDFLTIAVLLLFTALLFLIFGFPVLRRSLSTSQSLFNSPTSIDAQY